MAISTAIKVGGDEVEVENLKYLSYYASQSVFTEPGRMSGLLANLPSDLVGLQRVASRLVIHYRGQKPLEHGVPEERMREIDTRYAEEMLSRLAELKSGPLTSHRSLAERLVGCCRDFTVLFLTMVRAHGIPIRSRVGFAKYFIPGYSLDHEVAEVWDANEGRWHLVDPELGEDFKDPSGIHIDPLDLSRDRFLVAGSAWQQCRTGTADPETFLVHPQLQNEKTRGLSQIRHNMLQDLAALNKTEMILWDTWSDPAKTLTNSDFERLDRLAKMTSVTNPDVASLVRLYEDDPDLRVPDIVLSEDPLGGPTREVSWRK